MVIKHKIKITADDTVILDVSYYQKMIKIFFNQNGFRTEVIDNKIEFQKTNINTTRSGNNNYESLKPLRKGTIELNILDAKKLDASCSIYINRLIFLSIVIGCWIGIIGLLNFELSYIDTGFVAVITFIIILSIGYLYMKNYINSIIKVAFL